jgi:RNAse (barnase) inhibitor barstar
MEPKKHFIIEGKRIHDRTGFYDEIHLVLCPKFSGMGYNLDAFVDVLRGGFGAFDRGEKIIIEFKDYSSAKKSLGDGFFSKIISFLKANPDIELQPAIL